MEREIKFRAFDTHNQVFYYDVSWHGEDVFLTEKQILSSGFGLENLQHLELIQDGIYFVDNICFYNQYSGLKDRNGVEIYEGDIVRQDGGRIILEVKFNNGAFRLNQDTIFFRNSEVIGNIYQDSNLLENQNERTNASRNKRTK